MTSQLIENFTKIGSRFALLFFVLFIGFYFLFQTAPIKNAHQAVFKANYEYALTSFFPQLEIIPSYPEKNNPFYFYITFYSKPQAARMNAEAAKSGKGSFNIQPDFFTFDGSVVNFMYLPFLLALFLASPISWRKKLIATLLGLLIYWFFFMGIFLLKATKEIHLKKLDVYHFDGFFVDVLNTVGKVSNAGFYSFLIILIWFICMVMVGGKTYFFGEGQKAISVPSKK